MVRIEACWDVDVGWLPIRSNALGQSQYDACDVDVIPFIEDQRTRGFVKPDGTQKYVDNKEHKKKRVI